MSRSSAGMRLREIRTKLGLTSRNVERIGHDMAAAQGEEEFKLSHARLSQIESDESTPSIYKLGTLSAAYGLPLMDLVSFYVDLQALGAHQLSPRHKRTSPLSVAADVDGLSIELPLECHATAALGQTAPLTDLVKLWGDVPLPLLRKLDVGRCRYALIGLADYTMYPMLRPGSFVQIGEYQRPPKPRVHATEYDRPLYFIETRDGYICSWCEFSRDRLVIVPHPLSPCSTRDFKYPSEADIVGRVVGIAARLTSATPRMNGASVNESAARMDAAAK